MNTGPTKVGELVKFFCLLEELESSRDLIKSGFGHLQEIDMGNTFYHLPHQLMASGLERFMKCYVLLIYDGRHGSCPDNTYVRRLGHDLQKLLKLICTDFYGGTERAWVQRETPLRHHGLCSAGLNSNPIVVWTKGAILQSRCCQWHSQSTNRPEGGVDSA